MSRMLRLTRFGNSPFAMVAKRAAGVMVSAALPLRQASTIWLAARCALIETTGMPAAIENQANSRWWIPLNVAFTCEPVRINPGYLRHADTVTAELGMQRLGKACLGKLAHH